jgi:hypothetical protein
MFAFGCRQSVGILSAKRCHLRLMVGMVMTVPAEGSGRHPEIACRLPNRHTALRSSMLRKYGATCGDTSLSLAAIRTGRKSSLMRSTVGRRAR